MDKTVNVDTSMHREIDIHGGIEGVVSTFAIKTETMINLMIFTHHIYIY